MLYVRTEIKMSPEAQQILNIIQSIKPELWYTLGQLLVAALCVMLVRKGLQNFAAYLIFKSNKELAKNVKVMWGGKECVIMDFNYRHVHLKELDGGNKIILPMIKANTYEWEIIRHREREK